MSQAFESAQKALRELPRSSPYSYMMMRDRIGLYFQNALVARVLDGDDAVVLEFSETTPPEARDGLTAFLTDRGVPVRRADPPIS